MDSRFLNRSLIDLLMFTYVTGSQDTMHTVSDGRGIEKFIQRFGHICEDCTAEQLRKRLIRTRIEYLETLKTP